MGHRENTREVGRLQPKGRARDRACVERRHRRHELAWPGVTGQEGKHRGKSQRKWKQQPHGVSVCGSSQESLLFFGELGLFLSAGGPRLHCPGVLNHAGGLPCQEGSPRCWSWFRHTHNGAYTQRFTHRHAHRTQTHT